MAPATLSSSSEQDCVQLPQFERSLLLADTNALHAMGFPDAAAVVGGNYSFLTSPLTASSMLSSKLAHDLISNLHPPSTPPLLTETLHRVASGSRNHLCAIYVTGVGLLQAFLTINWAGPPLSQITSSDAHEATAAFLLASGGEDVARPARCLAWLRAARRVLVDCVDELVRAGAMLAPWWAARVLLAHQAVLSGLAPALRYDAFTMFGRFLGLNVIRSRDLYAADVVHENERDDIEEEEDDYFLPAPITEEGLIEDEEKDFIDVLVESDRVDARLKVLAYLELALAQKMYYDAEGAWGSLQKACYIERIAFRVTGEMGMRTKHQVKATAQLIAHAYDLMESTHTRPSLADFALNFPTSASMPNTGANCDQDKKAASLPLPMNVPVNDTDVLGYVRLTENQESLVTASDTEEEFEEGEEQIALGDEKEHLTPIQQALALGQATLVRARNASHILTREEMAPYVNLVIQNADSPFGTTSMVQIRALLLRVSFEQDRGRYLERCMSQMEEIDKFIDNPMDTIPEATRNSATAERNFLLFASSVPPRWELKKELAVSFGKIGLVKSAMEIFKKLEYWDELVDCHRLIGNLGAAEVLVRDQLELLDKAVLEEGLFDNSSETLTNVLKFGSQGAVHARAARRPRLLCVLGDVTRDKKYFETAWEESGFKYARAKRALARMCVETENWKEAVQHFKEALAINPLFPEVWFTYGCSAIQVNNVQLAAHAFTTVVQQTPDNGEAWNNLGRVLHELGKTKEALKALKEAAKSKRDSWRIWNNILMLATESRSSLDIVRSMERLLELRGKDGVVTESIGVAVKEVIRMAGSENVEDKSLVGPVCRRLLKVLGRSTALVSTTPSIWAAYAELHELVPNAGGTQKAFDCRLRQVRSLIAHDQWKSDRREFRHMALASDAMTRNAIHSRSALNIRAAKLHLQSVIEQTRADFKDDEGFLRLTQTRDRLLSNEFRVHK